MPLTKPAISALALEKSLLDLWEEFLSGYFDGANHGVGPLEAAVFPEAQLRFQQSAVDQPLDGVAITLVWVTPTRNRTEWEDVTNADGSGGRQAQAFDDVMLNFWIRAAGDQAAPTNARHECMKAASLLKGLIANRAATLPLAQKGIHHLRPMDPQLVAEGSSEGKASNKLKGGDAARLHALRLVSCRAELRYPIKENAVPFVPDLERTSEDSVMIQWNHAEGDAYYTLDGSEPTPSHGVRYTAAIDIAFLQPVTIKARVFGVGCRSSLAEAIFDSF